MKKLALLVALTTVAQSLCLAGADPKTDVKSAVKKLAEKSNYGWTATFIGTPEMRMGPLEGRTEKGGSTYCKFTFADNQIEMAFNGDKSAIKREGEWQSAEELESSNAGIARRLKTFKAPVAEAEELAEKTKELKGADGVYSGDLSAEGIKDLVSRWRRNPEITDGKGTVKFWVKDGLLTKYQYNIQGKVTGNAQNEVDLDRTVTVEIKDVGATQVSVPEDAKKKLT